MKDSRLEVYRYYDQLEKYLNNLGHNENIFFDNRLVYPRQFEIHLPGNHIESCQLSCPHCAGKLFDKTLGTWEIKGLDLLHQLKGSIPYHIYGGAYTEPLMNPYYMTYLATTKYYNNHFGIHTNGVLLKRLEENVGFLTELNRISTDREDYLSISIDAGTASSWAKTKGTKNEYWFYEILNGIRKAVEIRNNRSNCHSIRLCYLISRFSDTDIDFKNIVKFAKEVGVDSLRFSIPFANYNQDFEKVRKYKKDRELVYDEIYQEKLSKYLSTDQNDKPYIFYTGPEFTDVDKFDFDKCIYGYYQITFGADGYVYKCSTTATPTAKQCRLGKVTNNLKEFNQMILDNYNENWDCEKMCFNNGVRCNRMGLEINKQYQEMNRK